MCARDAFCFSLLELELDADTFTRAFSFIKKNGTREETHDDDDDETETDRVVRGVRDEETDRRVVRVVVGAWERCVCIMRAWVGADNLSNES